MPVCLHKPSFDYAEVFVFGAVAPVRLPILHAWDPTALLSGFGYSFGNVRLAMLHYLVLLDS